VKSAFGEFIGFIEFVEFVGFVAMGSGSPRPDRSGLAMTGVLGVRSEG